MRHEQALRNKEAEAEAMRARVSALTAQFEEMKQQALAAEAEARQRAEAQQAEVNRLTLQNLALSDDQKEREEAMVALRAENERLRLQSVDVANFRQWSPQQFAAWIVSKDGNYAQYEPALTQRLVEEGVDGSCIDGQIDTGELRRWGVVSYKHQRQILEHIRGLIEPEHAMVAEDNEGAATELL